jgi:hypothetical protein
MRNSPVVNWIDELIDPIQTGGARAKLFLQEEGVEDQRGGWKVFMLITQ